MQFILYELIAVLYAVYLPFLPTTVIAFKPKCLGTSALKEGLECNLFAVNLCSNPDDKLQIYRDNFEKAYLDSTERFYRTQAPSYLQQNGVQNYMKYVCVLHFFSMWKVMLLWYFMLWVTELKLKAKLTSFNFQL